MAQIDRLQTKDPELNRVQDRIIQAVNPALLHPFLQGHVIAGIVFQAGVAQDIAHKLDRPDASYIPVAFYSVGGTPSLWDERETLTDDQRRRFLRLTCASDATVDLFVF